MNATAQDRFEAGDRLIHPGKPEWGVGTVKSAAGMVHEGTPCQRLAIRFDRAGLKTISTAFVQFRRAAGGPMPEPKPEAKPEEKSGSKPFSRLEPAGESDPARPTRVDAGRSQIADEHDPFSPLAASGMPTDPREARRLMTAIPADAVDPFQTDTARLRSVLSLYRFEATPSSLMDWAAAQSGLSDPLSHFSRHELEEYFSDFQRNLTKALAKAVSDASRADPAELRSIAQSAPPGAQRALQSLHRRR